METKLCTKCGKDLPRTEFYTNYDKRSGKSYPKGECKTCSKALVKKYARENPDKAREWDRKKYKKHKAKIRARHKKYYKRYAKENGHKLSACRARRRARVRNAQGKLTSGDILRKYDLQGGRCYYCDVDLPGGYQVDHKIPLARGGSNWPANICVSCENCNYSKRDKDFWEFSGKSRPGLASGAFSVL